MEEVPVIVSKKKEEEKACTKLGSVFRSDMVCKHIVALNLLGEFARIEMCACN